jgi:hypothetical protein
MAGLGGLNPNLTRNLNLSNRPKGITIKKHERHQAGHSVSVAVAISWEVTTV